MQASDPTQPSISGLRRGATLIESLVVMVVLLTVTAVAIPVLSPAMAGRKVRESSRMLNVFINSARNKAIQTGRPAGVMFERVPGLPGAAATVSHVEVPVPWGANFSNSTLVVAGGVVPAGVGGRSTDPSTAFPAGDNPIGLIRPGDLVQLDYQGHLYVVNGPVDPATGFINEFPWTLTSSTQVLAPSTTVLGLPFQIIRQPVKSAAGSLQLPEGTAVDLDFSGLDNNLFLENLPDPAIATPLLDTDVIVTFNSTGALDDVYRWSNLDVDGNGTPDTFIRLGYEVLGPIHLLVGRREKIGGDLTLPVGDQFNWQDLTNTWVTLHPQTGLITSAENAAHDPTNVIPDLLEARRYALEGLSMGGR